MIPFTEIDRESDQGTTMRLYQRGEEFSIRVDRQGELMNSRLHHSEDVLAELACTRLGGRSAPRLLVGGLGMGFTLRAALDHAPNDAQVGCPHHAREHSDMPDIAIFRMYVCVQSSAYGCGNTHSLRG